LVHLWDRRTHVGATLRVHAMPIGRARHDERMATWHEVVDADPDRARHAGALFDAHRHGTMATIRADGSPRISGTESQSENGESVFGSMPQGRRGADLRRGARFALHSATADPVDGAEARRPGENQDRRRAMLAASWARACDGEPFRAGITAVLHPSQRPSLLARRRVVDAVGAGG